ncbi:MAG: inorganic pyrophosphatase [Ruminococcaceae bacterium]|nr:inorganic pyrophosphatase [Oscillospiraceae bacterium]
MDEKRKALAESYLGKTVDIVIDRPLGSSHPKYSNMIYPVNYGYIPNVIGGDGEELDVYLLGVNEAVKEYRARLIAVICRNNDVEDKLVASPESVDFSASEIKEAVDFQEKYFDSEIVIL